MENYLLEGYESENLVYIRVTPEHFEQWLPFYHNPKSTEFWEGLPTDPIIACQQQFGRIFERYQEKSGGMNALLLKDSNTLIGLCGLLVQTVDSIPELEIGYSILPDYWRRGFAFEAAQKCKQVAFENQWATSLISIIHIDNLPSRKVALKNGMVLDKTTTYKDNPVDIYRVSKEV